MYRTSRIRKLFITSHILDYFLWLSITYEGSVPEMRILPISILSDLKWCIHLSRSLLLEFNSSRAFFHKWLKERSYSSFAYMLFCNLASIDGQCHCVLSEIQILWLNNLFTHSTFNLCTTIWIFLIYYETNCIYILLGFFCPSVYILYMYTRANFAYMCI